MASDPLIAMLAAIDRRAAEDTTSLDEARRARSARTPDMNNPYQAPPHRGPRARSWRDPTGEQAIGNIKKEKRTR